MIANLNDILSSNIEESFIQEIDFESIKFDFSDILMESADIDSELVSINAANEISINCEDFKEVLSKAGKAVIEAIKKILVFITRILVFIGNVYMAPFRFIKDLIRTKNLKATIESMKLQFKDMDATAELGVEKFFKIAPNAKRLKRAASIQTEVYQSLRKWSKTLNRLPEWLDLYSNAYQDAINHMDDEAFKHWCDLKEEEFEREFFGDFSHSSSYDYWYDYYSGNDYNYSDSTETYDSEYDKWEKTVLNSDEFICQTSEEFVEAVEEVANMKSDREVEITINECKQHIRMLEKMTRDKKFETLPDSMKSKILKLLDGVKGRLITLSKVSAQQAQDVKDIVERLHEIETFQNK